MTDDRVLAALTALRGPGAIADPGLATRVREGGRRRLRRRRAAQAGVAGVAVVAAGGVPIGLALHSAHRSTLRSAPSLGAPDGSPTGSPERFLGLPQSPVALPTSVIDESGGRTPTVTRTACVNGTTGPFDILGGTERGCPAGYSARPLIIASQPPYTPPPVLPDTCVGLHRDLRLKWSEPKDFGFFPLNGAVVPTDAAGILDRTNDLPNLVDNAVTAANHLTDTAASAYWYAYGPVADGREVVVSESAIGNGPCHVYAVLRTTDPAATPVVVDGGLTQRSSPLPARVHLPAGLGWVVAGKGSALAWAPAGGATYTAVGVDAALLPDAAATVRVTPKSGAPVIVALG